MARSTEGSTTAPAAAAPGSGVPGSGTPGAGISAVVRARTSRRHPAVLSAWLMGARWRHAARWLGLAIFLSGAVLLYYVFMEAWQGFQRFTEPDYLGEALKAVPLKDTAANVRAIVVILSSELLRVLYLLLGFVASAIAARGIQFFSASEAVIDEAVVPDMAEDDEDV